MLLLNFRHRQQRAESDCLVACTEMALMHLGLTLSYEQLSKLLKAGPLFTPFGHLRYLEPLRLSLTLAHHGSLAVFEQNIELGLPVLVAVKTIRWQHWQNETTDHAVVVIGIDRHHQLIYIHDPAFPGAPIEMPLLEFEIGWAEKDRQYAIIGLADIDTA